MLSGRELLRYRVNMGVVHELEKLSTCCLHQVGALLYDPITKDITKIGYNGAPHGVAHCSSTNRITDGLHHLNCIHAETNVLLKAGIQAKGGVLFCTLTPCRRCAILCTQAQIKEFVYEQEYNMSDDVDFTRELFSKQGIKMTWLNPGL